MQLECYTHTQNVFNIICILSTKILYLLSIWSAPIYPRNCRHRARISAKHQIPEADTSANSNNGHGRRFILRRIHFPYRPRTGSNDRGHLVCRRSDARRASEAAKTVGFVAGIRLSLDVAHPPAVS